MKKSEYWKLSFIFVFIFLIDVQVHAQSGTWVKKTDMPTVRAAASASIVNGKIYVIGGCTSSLTDLSTNEMYDPAADTWETKAPMPTARGFLYTAVVNDTIYAIGGGYPAYKIKVEAYDPVTNTWTPKKDMPEGHIGCNGAGVINDIIYIVGGNYNERECWAYNPTTDTWIQKASMPSDGGGSAAITAYNGLIYSFGGSTYPPWNGLKTVYEYNPQTDTWAKKNDMPTARFALKTYLVDNKIYALGGADYEGGCLSTVEVYDPGTDMWETKSDMPISTSYFTGAVANDKIYVFGKMAIGWGGGWPDVWEYDPAAPFYFSLNKINFGDILAGHSSNTIPVTIKNISLQAFSITSITHSQNDYSLLNLPSFPVTLQPSDSIQFEVSFHPNKRGRIDDEIIVNSNNTGYPVLTIPLEGRGILFGPQFQLFVDRINSAPVLNRTAIVDSFLTVHSIMPLIEDSICVFIYSGTAEDVCVAGDFNDWNSDIAQMTTLSTTNLRYYSEVFEPDARLDYLFVINGIDWILDPCNPNEVASIYGPNSELAMPEYVQPLEIKYYPNISHGTIHTFSFTSNILGNSRTIKVYTPPDYDSNPDTYYPIILFHDGLEYITIGSADNTIDYLISEERIEPVIAVFVPPVQRDDEYAFNLTQQYESFIVDELMLHIDAEYRTLPDPESRAMAGLSYGGLLTTQICYNRAESFGLAAPYSPSYWANEKAIFNSVLGGIKKNIKWYVDWGTYEPVITSNARLFKDGLEASQYEVKWNEWHEAHCWGSWRAHLDNALEFFFPGSAVNVEDKKYLPLAFELSQNYPNPFNPSTTLSFVIGYQSAVTLKVYDVLGNEVANLVNEEKPAGTYKIIWNAINLSSGVYYYQLKAGSFIQTKKMILLH